jgi:hypothetical protein
MNYWLFSSFFNQEIVKGRYLFLVIFFSCWIFQIRGSNNSSLLPIDLWGKCSSLLPTELWEEYVFKQLFDHLSYDQKDSDRVEDWLLIGVKTQLSALKYRLTPYVCVNVKTGQISFKGVLTNVSEVCKAWNNVWNQHAARHWLSNRICLPNLAHESVLKRVTNYAFLMYKQVKEECCLINQSKNTLLDMFRNVVGCDEVKDRKHLLLVAPYIFIRTAIQRASITNKTRKNILCAPEVSGGFFCSRHGGTPDMAVRDLLFLVATGSVFLPSFLNDDESVEIVDEAINCIDLYEKVLLLRDNHPCWPAKTHPILQPNSVMLDLKKEGCFPVKEKQADMLVCAMKSIFVTMYRFDQYWTKNDHTVLTDRSAEEQLVFFYFKIIFDWQRCCLLDNAHSDTDKEFGIMQLWIFKTALLSISNYFNGFLPQESDFPETNSPLCKDNFLSSLLYSCKGNASLFCSYLKNPKDVSQKIIELHNESKKHAITLTDEVIIQYFYLLNLDYKNLFFTNLLYNVLAGTANTTATLSEKEKVVKEMEKRIAEQNAQYSQILRDENKLIIQNAVVAATKEKEELVRELKGLKERNEKDDKEKEELIRELKENLKETMRVGVETEQSLSISRDLAVVEKNRLEQELLQANKGPSIFTKIFLITGSLCLVAVFLRIMVSMTRLVHIVG